MKRFCMVIYCLVIAAFVLSLSGCGGSSSSDNSSSTSTADRLMVVSSPVLQKGGSYKLYRGDNVNVNDLSYNPKYYVAPITPSDPVTMNLQFADSIAEDKPFAITTDDNGVEKVVFYYNPNGEGQDTTKAFGSVLRNGGSTQQLSYSGLTLSSAAVTSSFMSSIINDLDYATEIVLDLDGDTAQIDGAAVPSYNYAWHADPDHRDEYYTRTLDGTTELTEAEMMMEIDEGNGVYINRDIRYMPNTISFTGTAKNDEETEYVAYYSESVQKEVAEELGTGFEGPYIFATLPQSAGMAGPGGMRGGPDGQGNPADQRTRPNDPSAALRGSISNSDVSLFSTMTHSPEDAYNNPVLHITESGLYRLKGTWHGQIWIDVGDDAEVVLLLDNVTVTCDVAPALVFHDVHECGPEDESTVSSEWRTLGSEVKDDAGAVVVIADGSTNSFTGANVYRMLKAQKKKDSVTTIDGTDVSQQKKLYKMDGAFYSFVSMVIGAESSTNPGTLNITSTTYEGLDTEMHLTIDSGTINVTAEDDGINVNEDDVSVFTMLGGNLTVVAKGGDGIDSNGYIVIDDGVLNITAAQDSNSDNAQAEGPLDADKGVYISDTARANYTHQAYSGNSNTQPTTPDNNTPSDNTGTGTTTTKKAFDVTDETSGKVVMSVRYTTPEVDNETTDRGIKPSDNVFILTHTVNDFSGIK